MQEKKKPKPFDNYACNYCNHEFPTYQQALEHEEQCVFDGSVGDSTLPEDSSRNMLLGISTTFMERQNPRDVESTRETGAPILDGSSPPSSSHSTINTEEDNEFLRNNAVDELLRIYCTEHESILMSMLCTWRTHMGMPKLPDDELKARVRLWFDSKVAQTNSSSINPNASFVSQRHIHNVIDSRHLKTPEVELLVMEDIDHLCYTIHRSGYPCIMKTVMDTFTDTLYDFKVEVRQSLIANAGSGLFLTFIGARTLKPDVKKWSQALKSNRHAMHVITKDERVACLPDNKRVLVKLKGENLHGNHNNPFFCITRFPLCADIHSAKQVRSVKVTLQGLHLHEDIDFLHTQGLIPSYANGLGWLDVFSESDYIQDETKTFSSYQVGCGLLHLGKYGPLHKTDMKCPLVFNLKDFIFCQEPAVWNFGNEAGGLIDMTDDSTGFPHAFARDNICIYCNEVGHDKNLLQTILALEKDNGSVHYYIKITNPLKMGDTIELLVSYTASYEESRERKGYGIRNKKGFASDTDLTERTCRNIHDRLWIERGISSSSSSEFCRVLDFTRERVLTPINGFLKQNYGKILDSVAISKTNSTQAYQKLIARQRIKWVGEIFKHYKGEKIIPQSQSDILTQNETIELMTDWNLKTFLGGKISMTGDMIKYIESEFLEETVFNIYRKYGKAHLFDPSHYCQMSRDLTANLLTKAGRYFYFQANDASTGNFLSEVFSIAKNSIQKVRSLLDRKLRIDRDDLEMIGLRYHRQKTRHLPLTILAHETVNIRQDDLIVFIMIDDKRSFCGKPVKISNLDPVSSAKIDVHWLVLSQIVSTVHMIAETIQDEGYSLERLCEYLDINIQDAQVIVSQNMMNPVDADVYTSSG